MRSEFCPSTVSVLGLLAVSGVVALAGCGSSSNAVVTTTATTTPGSPASNVYVAQGFGFGANANVSSILQFSASATGTATPVSTLTAPGGVSFNSVSTDGAGQIYAGGTGTAPEILVYAAASSGTAAPLRTIVGGTGSFTYPASMAIDSNGLLYVADGGNTPAGNALSNMIAVFSASATGNATPIRLIQGPLTQINNARQIALDAAGDLYVANGWDGSILVFAPGANGNVAPARVIATGAVNGSTGIAVDASGNVYAVTYLLSYADTAIIVEYAAGATGNAAPVKVIDGPLTGLGIGGSLSVDGAGNLYTLGNAATPGPGAPGPPFVAKFAPSASGNVAPLSMFTPASTDTFDTQIALK